MPGRIRLPVAPRQTRMQRKVRSARNVKFRSESAGGDRQNAGDMHLLTSSLSWSSLQKLDGSLLLCASDPSFKLEQKLERTPLFHALKV
ncbi:hypothetical protein Fuma_03466 [Fuerstiella marisgermanici]|uniref:Uncharacterized protein n=1 Tax=Fuerstiella marisgermanici TaxID=1891926 RepID=A0A1P8WIG9_9PLAN|nr:hypothetical protein Fuma_03466 [Fuerstiella marisgermanici]